MNTRTTWHEPGRGFFTVERGEKVRRVKANCRGEREILQRYEMRGEEACVVRLAGKRRVILEEQALWENREDRHGHNLHGRLSRGATRDLGSVWRAHRSPLWADRLWASHGTRVFPGSRSGMPSGAPVCQERTCYPLGGQEATIGKRAPLEDAGWTVRKVRCGCTLRIPDSVWTSPKHRQSSAGAEREVVGIDQQWIKRTGTATSTLGTSQTYTTATFGSAEGQNAGKITNSHTSSPHLARVWHCLKTST